MNALRPIALLAALALPVATGHAADLASEVLAVAPVSVGLSAEARVEAVRTATVAAQVPGRVTAVRVDAGQRVKAGELLLTIDARELAGAEAAGQAQLAQAQAQWQRSQQLFKQKFISQSALDQAELAYKAAKAQAGASGASLSHANVTAPITGVVGERLIEVGEMAQPGRPLVTVYDPAVLRVVASVPQARLADLRAKPAAAVIELAESGRPLAVTRVEVLPTVDAASHTATVRLYLGPNEPGVVPGMAARVRLATGTAEKLTVPMAAVLRRGEVTAVYVLPESGVPRLRQVRLGERLGDGRLEVLAGLRAGERVALDPVKAGIVLKQR